MSREKTQNLLTKPRTVAHALEATLMNIECMDGDTNDNSDLPFDRRDQSVYRDHG